VSDTVVHVTIDQTLNLQICLVQLLCANIVLCDF